MGAPFLFGGFNPRRPKPPPPAANETDAFQRELQRQATERELRRGHRDAFIKPPKNPSVSPGTPGGRGGGRDISGGAITDALRARMAGRQTG